MNDKNTDQTAPKAEGAQSVPVTQAPNEPVEANVGDTQLNKLTSTPVVSDNPHEYTDVAEGVKARSRTADEKSKDAELLND